MSTSQAAFDHAVQFYEQDAFLCDRVADFLEDGLRAGEPAVVIATGAHRAAISGSLQARGCDLERVTFLDARETLNLFMCGGMPDGHRFVAAISDTIKRRGNGAHVRAYGEMVDVLWRDGNPEAAIRLEELWNELGQDQGFSQDFSLLCGYPIGNFSNESDGGPFATVCSRHSHVVPTEQYTGRIDDDARAREISFLQQRAAALETEIERRRRTEEINAFLADASATLNRSLDYDSRLREIHDLIVPRLADSCTLEVLGDGERSESEPRIDGSGAHMIVPLRLPDRPLGSITLSSNTTGRFSNDDLALALELARRAAIALENARLYRLAQEANRTKDEFLATLSHELRTPLTAVLGWARMLILGGLDDETRAVALDTIERSARAQATLIDDLLDLSRIVTGKLRLQDELVDLISVIANAVQTQRLAADAKGITIEVKAAGERAVVNGDPTRLQQIIWNLLSNAIKFSETGMNVTIELDRDDDEARLIVRDEGRGITPEFLPHVFEPFRQADGASTRRHGGLGLGLAVVKYLTELHGGSVTAVSRGTGQGATFTITLPLALQLK
jgi:signal transduction histidine kinase